MQATRTLEMDKKQKRPYKRSFAKRLTWRIMLTLLLVMGITSVLIFQAAMATIDAESEIFCGRLVNDKSKDVRHILSDIFVASTNTIPIIEENLDKPDKLYGIMERIVRLNPLIHSCGISFSEKYYPQKGRLFCPYAIQRDNVTIEKMNLNDSIHDYLQSPWFTEGLKAEKGYWAEPFFDGSDMSEPLVSFLAPIHDSNGKNIAVFGADLSLNDLEDELIGVKRQQEKIEEKELKRSYTGNDGEADNKPTNKLTNIEVEDFEYAIYYFIIDSAGTYIMHPDMKRIIRENYFTYAKQAPDTLATLLGQEMAKGRKGSINDIADAKELTIENVKVHAFFHPIKNTNWSICLVVPSLFINLIGYILGGILLFLIGLGLTVVFFVGRHSIKRTVKPLKQLAYSADEVAEGNFKTPLPALNSHDEIHLLRDSFEQMQSSLTNYVEKLKATTAQKASMESELKIAHDIQMSMLPKVFPPYPERNDIDIYGRLTPAKAVGGDLFDFYIRDEKLFFCIGDVSGKGVPASLFMAVTHSLFRNVSAHLSEPHRIVSALNSSIDQGNELDMFVTLFVGVLDLQTGLLSYSNAGHNAPLLIDQDIHILPCNPNLPIGIIDEWDYTPQQVMLQPQTTIFLYTDGLNEAEDNTHAQFGDDRIVQIAKQQLSKHQLQPKILIDSMTKAVHDFVGDAEQSDDMTMLTIQYNKAQ